jgi:hypothetical protein
MEKITISCALVLTFMVIGGCAGMSTYPAHPNEANGIRVYPQKIYLLVDKESKSSKLISLPDVKNAYDVKPWSFLSKHDFTIKIEDAQIKELTSDQDSSAALSLLQKIVELAGEVAKEAAKGGSGGKAVADIDFKSSLGFDTGVYELTEKGMFVKVSP